MTDAQQEKQQTYRECGSGLLMVVTHRDSHLVMLRDLSSGLAVAVTESQFMDDFERCSQLQEPCRVRTSP